MANDLPAFGLGSLAGSSPNFTVDHQQSPDDPAPSLHPHYRASPLLRAGPPLCPASVLCPSQSSLLGVLPLAAGRPTRSSERPSVSGRQVPTFRTRAWTRLAPPPCRTPPGQQYRQPPDSSQTYHSDLVSMSVASLDTSSAVRSRSPSWTSPDALTARLVRNAHHPGS